MPLAERIPVTTIAALDTMPAGEAASLLQSCCGARGWVSGMLVRRPFGTRAQLLQSADEQWESLERSDWLEAFAHHPRLGERRTQAVTSQRARKWSAAEQSRLSGSASSVRDELADANREYEARFGYLCITCAAGKTAEEILESTRRRLHNTTADELRIAAEEQRLITRLRLERLVDDTTPGASE